MISKTLTATVLALALSGAVGLRPAAATQIDKKEVRSDSTAVTVRVENNNWHDMRIYVISHGAVYRLGTVGGFQTRVLRVPRHVSGRGVELQLVADPIGARGVTYAPVIGVGPGDQLEYRIGSSLGLSTLSRF